MTMETTKYSTIYPINNPIFNHYEPLFSSLLTSVSFGISIGRDCDVPAAPASSTVGMVVAMVLMAWTWLWATARLGWAPHGTGDLHREIDQWIPIWLMLIDADLHDLCWLMLICADWCWLMLIDADWCWFTVNEPEEKTRHEGDSPTQSTQCRVRFRKSGPWPRPGCVVGGTLAPPLSWDKASGNLT